MAYWKVIVCVIFAAAVLLPAAKGNQMKELYDSILGKSAPHCAPLDKLQPEMSELSVLEQSVVGRLP